MRWSDSAAVRVALIVATIGTFASPPVTNVAVALALVLALASQPMRARLVVAAGQPLGRAALILLALMALAMTWADAAWRARFDAWWNWRTMLLIVLTAAAFGDVRWKERFCLWLVAAVAIGAVASFAMWLANVTTQEGYPGTLLRNHVTQSMAMTCGVLIAAVLAAQPERSMRSRALLVAAALVCLANLVLVAAGRSGQVALVVAALSAVFLMFRGWRRWRIVLVLLALAAGLAAASPMLKQRFYLVAREAPSLDCAGPENSTGLRLLLWRTTGELIRARPWFGYGVGGFMPAYAGEVQNHLRGEPLTGWCARPVHDPHNQFLRVTVEAGVLGLIAFLGLIAGAARQPAAQPYRTCGVALLAAWCTTSLFNSHFQTFNEGHLIALLLGALLAPDQAQAASAPSTAERTSS
ncbi:MAG TPA: O-antigen ligase family protein [Burkholderiaceae bacterium]|nr:O-antigen ligase family protein [Burkholderiaceae bacterium]